MFASEFSEGATAVYVASYTEKDGLTVRAYGEAAPGVPATTADHFQIGSVTKSVFATAVLQQVEKGTIKLTDTVGALDPALAKQYPMLRKVTVRQLLSMSTQVPDYGEAAADKQFADPSIGFSRADLIALGFDEGEPVPKGGAYSTTSYIILGNVMQKVTGKTPARLVNDVLKQAKMSQSLLTVAGTRPAPATHGYIGTRYGSVAAQVNPSLSASTDVTVWPTTWGREGGGAYSTIGDLAAWAKLCVGDGLLDDAMVAARHSTHEIDAGDNGMGIVKTRTWWGHEGQTVGYEATAQCNPKTGGYVAIAVNSSTGLVGALGTVGRAAAPAFVKQRVLAEFT